jgi:heme/copper-type cytochrome/quinol oxidase subunit 2
MLNTIATVVVVVLGIHVITKFAFFALPYRRRRALLDKQYGDKASATTRSDLVLMVFTVMVAALLFWRGVEAVSFLGGLWIGATLIQLYFHQFHRPVPPQRAAPPQTSPLKEMSYAIQDAPWRPWPQLLTLTVLVVFSRALIL